MVFQCASSQDVARLYGTTRDTLLDPLEVGRLAPGVLYVLTQKHSCSSDTQPHLPPGGAAGTTLFLCSVRGHPGGPVVTVSFGFFFFFFFFCVCVAKSTATLAILCFLSFFQVRIVFNKTNWL